MTSIDMYTSNLSSEEAEISLPFFQIIFSQLLLRISEYYNVHQRYRWSGVPLSVISRIC